MIAGYCSKLTVAPINVHTPYSLPQCSIGKLKKKQTGNKKTKPPPPPPPPTHTYKICDINTIKTYAVSINDIREA